MVLILFKNISVFIAFYFIIYYTPTLDITRSSCKSHRYGKDLLLMRKVRPLRDFRQPGYHSVFAL